MSTWSLVPLTSSACGEGHCLDHAQAMTDHIAAVELLRSLEGKTVTDFHASVNKATGQPVTVTLWFDEGPPVLFDTDDDGLLISVDDLPDEPDRDQ